MEAGRGLGGWEKRGVSLLQQPKVPTPQLLAKVEEFYEDLQDEAGAQIRRDLCSGVRVSRPRIPVYFCSPEVVQGLLTLPHT